MQLPIYLPIWHEIMIIPLATRFKCHQILAENTLQSIGHTKHCDDRGLLCESSSSSKHSRTDLSQGAVYTAMATTSCRFRRSLSRAPPDFNPSIVSFQTSTHGSFPISLDFTRCYRFISWNIGQGRRSGPELSDARSTCTEASIETRKFPKNVPRRATGVCSANFPFLPCIDRVSDFR